MRDREDFYKQKIFEIKWGSRFVCKKCKGRKSTDGKAEYSKKCSNCSYEESVIMNTAFEGQHISLTKAVGILLALQENYMEYHAEFVKLVFKSEKNMNLHGNEGKLNLKGNARIPSQEIAHQFKMQKKSVTDYINKIADWMPSQYGKKSESLKQWFVGLKTDDGKTTYTKIFNLLFMGEELSIEARPMDEIIYFLVRKGKLEV